MKAEACLRPGFDRQLATVLLQALAHAAQAVAGGEFVRAAPVVARGHVDPALLAACADPEVAGAGVAHRVGDDFLRAAQQHVGALGVIERERRLNAELRATRALLAESARVNERTRISRELHDLLGHHLTALSLNLEVAGHLVEGRAQEHVNQAHTLARLLLSDVREAVSRLRTDDAIDMAATLLPLADHVAGLRIHMDMPCPFLLDDPERAHVLLRCTQEIITNAVRHAGAAELRLQYAYDDSGVRVQASDDGRGAESPVAGNGLRGMRERLAAYGGRVDIATRPGEGFLLDIRLPLEPGRPAPTHLAGEAA